MTERELRDLVSDDFDVPPEVVDDSYPLNQDSLSLTEIIIEVENATDVEITDEEADGVKTLGDLKALLRAKAVLVP